MTDAYSPRIIRLAEECGKKLGIPLQHGVYAGLQGPSFETPAEYNWIRVIGGDAVGMSTVPEIISPPYGYGMFRYVGNHQ